MTSSGLRLSFHRASYSQKFNFFSYFYFFIFTVNNPFPTPWPEFKKAEEDFRPLGERMLGGFFPSALFSSSPRTKRSLRRETEKSNHVLWTYCCKVQVFSLLFWREKKKIIRVSYWNILEKNLPMFQNKILVTSRGRILMFYSLFLEYSD